jgi:Flp pilus assembly protein TadG
MGQRNHLAYGLFNIFFLTILHTFTLSASYFRDFTMIIKLVARSLRNFCGDTKGASAIEFAIIGSLFLLFLFGLFGVGMRYAGNVALENTVYEAGRFVRTGQAQAMGQAAFLKAVCEGVTPPLTCGDLHFDIRTFDSFENAELTAPQENDDSYSYDPGGRNEVVVVRAFYKWPLLSYLPAPGEDAPDVLVATAVFRNEPF